MRKERMGKTYVKTQCDNCGKEIEQALGDYNRSKHHYCSQKCQAEYRHNQAYEERVCEICGKRMHVAKRSKQRFCSSTCQNEWQKAQVGEGNVRYRRIDVACSWCGKNIKAHPCKKRDFQQLFCDSKCRKAWYANVWSQRNEWKDESRRRAVKILGSGAISFTNSKPQNIINKILDNQNISYINEYDCKYFAMDNYLIDSGLMLEIMGDFWHTNPVVYQSAKYDKQIARIKSDRAKQTYIFNQYGVHILYLWEKDICEQPEMCTQLIKEYINNKGVLTDYHSFNYELLNGQLTIKSDLIVPYFEQRNCVANAQSFGTQG